MRKRFGGSLKDAGPIAFKGEAGYQAAPPSKTWIPPPRGRGESG